MKKCAEYARRKSAIGKDFLLSTSTSFKNLAGMASYSSYRYYPAVTYFKVLCCCICRNDTDSILCFVFVSVLLLDTPMES